MRFDKRLWVIALAACLAGCEKPAPTPSPTTGTPPTAELSGPPKVRKLANSEYPSWQVFDVANRLGYIDKTEGKLGPLEQKYNIDLVLVRGEYTETIKMYGSKTVDAVTITNTDILKPSQTRESVAIFPTSTSQGADACIVTAESGIKTIADLKGKTIYGAEKSVSEYVCRRNTGKAGLQSGDYKFSDMDPGAASTAMIQGQQGFDAIMVWEPFVENVLRSKPGSKVLFDSTTIPMEVIDMVVVGKDSYESQGGKEFCALLGEVYYNTCLAISKDDEMLVALGSEFAKWTAAQMRVVHNPQDPAKSKCRFFETPQQGMEVFTNAGFPDSLRMIGQFSKEKEIIKTEPNVVYASTKSVPAQASSTPTNLTFTTDVMKPLTSVIVDDRKQIPLGLPDTTGASKIP